MKKLSIILLGAVLAGCAGPQGQLTSLAEERLSLAPDIAWYKHSRNVPVYDPARETAVLQTVMAAGQQQGLNPDTVRRFFANEMEASRRIQKPPSAGGRARWPRRTSGKVLWSHKDRIH